MTPPEVPHPDLDALEGELIRAIDSAADLGALEEVRVTALGRPDWHCCATWPSGPPRQVRWSRHGKPSCMSTPEQP